LRAHQHHAEGRARLREPTTVEHALARVDHIQGPKARYKGVRKNALDLRRVAVIADLQRMAPAPEGRVTLGVRLSSGGLWGLN
jgi:hypothetical protein